MPNPFLDGLDLVSLICDLDLYSLVKGKNEVKSHALCVDHIGLLQRSPAKETKKTFFFRNSLNYQGYLDFVKDL
jgi:hypothetical protein